MAIAPELRAQILRLFQAERWRVGTIARQLGVHHSTVLAADLIRTNLDAVNGGEIWRQNLVVSYGVGCWWPIPVLTAPPMDRAP